MSLSFKLILKQQNTLNYLAKRKIFAILNLEAKFDRIFHYSDISGGLKPQTVVHLKFQSINKGGGLSPEYSSVLNALLAG